MGDKAAEASDRQGLGEEASRQGSAGDGDGEGLARGRWFLAASRRRGPRGWSLAVVRLGPVAASVWSNWRTAVVDPEGARDGSKGQSRRGQDTRWSRAWAWTGGVKGVREQIGAWDEAGSLRRAEMSCRLSPSVSAKAPKLHSTAGGRGWRSEGAECPGLAARLCLAAGVQCAVCRVQCACASVQYAVCSVCSVSCVGCGSRGCRCKTMRRALLPGLCTRTAAIRGRTGMECSSGGACRGRVHQPTVGRG